VHWTRRIAPLYCHRASLWLSFWIEPHSSLSEDVPRRVDIPVDEDATLGAVEGAPLIRVLDCSRPTYRAVHTRSSRCHVDDRYSFPSRLVLNLSLALVEAAPVELRSVVVALAVAFSLPFA